MDGGQPGRAGMSRGLWVLVGCAVTAIVLALVGQVAGIAALLVGADEPVAAALPSTSPVAVASVAPPSEPSPSASPSAAAPSPTAAAPKPSATKAPAPP